MRKGTVSLFVFLALASLGLALVPQVSSQPADIKVVSYSYYVDNIPYFDVVGEVQNVGPNTIQSVVLSGTVYTMDGVAQAYSYPTTVWVGYLLPQQKAPFYMEFPPEICATGDLSWLSLGVDRVDFVVNQANATGSYQYPDLVTSSSGGADAGGTYWVTGTVKNTGSQTATNIRVIGTFYNASGTVVAVGNTGNEPLTPSSLSPSGTLSFKFGAWDLNQTEVPSNLKISSYSLLVQAEGPILSGTAPSTPPSSPSPGTSPSDNPPSSPTPSNSAPTSFLTPEAVRGIIVLIAIVGVAGTILFLRRKKSQAKSQATTKRKPQYNRRKRRSKVS